MTKQLSAKQKAKIQEANELGQQCLQIVREINQAMVRLIQEESH